jgi:hypothetical protein
MQDLGGLGMAVFHFFSCPVELVLLVYLVVFEIFFSLNLQFVILQRIVDIYALSRGNVFSFQAIQI